MAALSVRILTTKHNNHNMTEAEKILENLPSVKIGLDDHYGKQTVLNALNQALSVSGVIFCSCCKMNPKPKYRKYCIECRYTVK